ncbi:MAG: pyridoxal-phosphate dependent enzyme [Planctomycetaceae bacterium]|nr:pyridoxal-phosphate dependent enzyme [Planctomycetaceae bacterium]
MAYLECSPDYQTLPSEYSRDAISAAAARLSGQVHRTPVLENAWLNRQLGCRVFFKCEHFQRGGAFKIRGAMNSVLQLSNEQSSRGVVTHSSGNHAQALAIASQIRGIPCTVVMPENSPAVKMQATKDRGATVVTCRPTQAARIAATQAIVDQTGATLIHPFDQPNIILGQATAAWELLTEVPHLTAIFAPVGGGGLLSGTCLAGRWFHSDRRVPVFAAEPLGANDAFRSLQQQALVTEQQPQTIADGLLTTLGQLTWPIIRSHLQGIVTVADQEITAAMRIFWERLKWVVEPSGAVSLAGLQQWLPLQKADGRKSEPDPCYGVIISGGNRDFMSGV